MILIVDGYNVIGAWPNLRPLELAHARDTLLGALAEYAAFTDTKVTLVFDAHLSNKAKRTIERVLGVEVVYTRSGETADHYIERMVDRLTQNAPTRGPVRISVATSDALEQSIVLSRGALRISSMELKRIIDEGTHKRRAHVERFVPRAAPTVRMRGDVAERLRELGLLGDE